MGKCMGMDPPGQWIMTVSIFTRDLVRSCRGMDAGEYENERTRCNALTCINYGDEFTLEISD